jgi:hypothetical protein
MILQRSTLDCAFPYPAKHLASAKIVYSYLSVYSGLLGFAIVMYMTFFTMFGGSSVPPLLIEGLTDLQM